MPNNLLQLLLHHHLLLLLFYLNNQKQDEIQYPVTWLMLGLTNLVLVEEKVSGPNTLNMIQKMFILI